MEYRIHGQLRYVDRTVSPAHRKRKATHIPLPPLRFATYSDLVAAVTRMAGILHGDMASNWGEHLTKAGQSLCEVAMKRRNLAVATADVNVTKRRCIAELQAIVAQTCMRGVRQVAVPHDMKATSKKI